MALRFRLLSGDVSGTPALYCAPAGEGAFAVLEVERWEDLDSSAVPTHGTYNVVAGYVYLDSNLDHDALVARDSALRNCGYEIDSEGNVVNSHDGALVAPKGRSAILCCVEAMWSFGAKDVAADVSGNNLRKCIRAAKEGL